jgi:hypothetical protein
MLPYDFVDRNCRDPVDIPLAAQLLMISGIIPGLRPLWMGTNRQAPRLDQYRHIFTSNSEFSHNMINFPK